MQKRGKSLSFKPLSKMVLILRAQNPPTRQHRSRITFVEFILASDLVNILGSKLSTDTLIRASQHRTILGMHAFRVDSH